METYQCKLKAARSVSCTIHSMETRFMVSMFAYVRKMVDLTNREANSRDFLAYCAGKCFIYTQAFVYTKGT